MIIYILIALMIVAVVAGSLAVERFMNGTCNASFWLTVFMFAAVLTAAMVGLFAAVFVRQVT